MSYAIVHEGKAFGPDGLITDTEGKPLLAEHAEDYNRQVAEQELAWLKTAPDKVFLYVHLPKYVTASMSCGPAMATELDRLAITTFLGTVLGVPWIGPRRHIGYGCHTYRRPVSVKLFGVQYHGWYMESSGDYCRLRKAKKQ